MGILVGESAFLAAFGVDGWSFQSAVLVTIFLALRRDFLSGSLILAALLLPIEWLVVAPAGYYALSLVVVFLALQLVRGSIQSDWGRSLGCSCRPWRSGSFSLYWSPKPTSRRRFCGVVCAGPWPRLCSPGRWGRC